MAKWQNFLHLITCSRQYYILAKTRGRMTTAITFSRRNDAGSRVSNTQYWENLNKISYFVVVLVSESKPLYCCVEFATLETSRKLGRVNVCKDFWVCYKGQVKRLAINWLVRPSNNPTNTCGTHFGPFLVSKVVNCAIGLFWWTNFHLIFRAMSS